MIQNNAARCWQWRNGEKIKGRQTSDRTITPGRRWVFRRECPGQDTAFKCGDAGVSSVCSCVTAGHGFLYKSCGFGSRFPDRLLWGEEGGKADHPSQAKAQSSFLTNPAFPPFFRCVHTLDIPPPLVSVWNRAVVTTEGVRSFLSVTRSQRLAGLVWGFLLNPDSRWGRRECWNPGMQHHK